MRLALGTVQFGLDYGISNHDGQVSDEELDAIIALARQAGIDTLDTAQAYGNAEQRLGQEISPASLSSTSWHQGYRSPMLRQRSTTACIGWGENGSMVCCCTVAKMPHLPCSSYSPICSNRARSENSGSPSTPRRSSIPGAQLAILWNWCNYLPICSNQRFLRTGWLDKLVDMGCEIHVRSLFYRACY